jgi:hypothetical protein
MIDYREGFIYLPMAINPAWTLQISGVQKKTAYLYDSLDLNPFYNEDFVDESSYLFYWKPNDSTNGIHWLQFYNDKCIECSDPAYKLLFDGSFNPVTIVGLERDAIDDELSHLGDNSSKYIFLKEVSFKKPPASIKVIDIHERQILSSDFDYVKHHQVSLTDGASERGLQYPLNNTIVVATDYQQPFTDTEILEYVSRYAGPGKVVQLFNPQKPTVLSSKDENAIVTVTLSLSEGDSYYLWKEDIYQSDDWDNIAGPITDSTYDLEYTSPLIGVPSIQRYKMTIMFDEEHVETNFIIEVMEGG